METHHEHDCSGRNLLVLEDDDEGSGDCIVSLGSAGKISWLSQGTRPDLSYSALILAKNNNSATISDLRSVNKIVGKVRKEENKVVYRRVGDKEI